MSYQGIIMAVVVTVAVGAAIYNYFSGNQRENPHGYGCGGGENKADDCNYTFTPRTASNPRPRKKKEEECTICLSVDKRDFIALSCGHFFHKHCISTWFNTDRSCPNCRRRISNAL